MKIRSIENIKNKKGYSTFEAVIISLIMIMVLGFLVDLAIISWKFNFVSQTNSYIARTVGQQSGIKTKAPDGFPGEDKAYITSQELYSGLQRDFRSAGFDLDKWNVYVNGRKLTASSNYEFRDLTQPIKTEIKAKYKWTIASNFLPNLPEKNLRSVRSIFGSFVYRENDVQILK